MRNKERRAQKAGLSITQVRKKRVHIYQMPDGKGGTKTQAVPESGVAALREIHGEDLQLLY